MKTPASTLIVIPAYNEQDTIASVVGSIRREGYPNILVVDDASTDETRIRALSAGAKVVSLAYQLGAWKATQTGMRYAHYHEFDQVITFDADGQHLPDSIGRLLASTPDADLVVGSCLQRGSLLRRFAWRYFRILSGVGLLDFTSGLRLYKKNAVNILAREEASLLEYQDIGVLMLLASAKLTFREVDVRMAPRASGISRIFNSWRAVAYYMVYTTFLCLAKFGHSPFSRVDLAKPVKAGY